MRLNYTANAEAELQLFYERQRTKLEQVVRDRKYVFGDEQIEITASDIREASRYIQPIASRRHLSRAMRQMITRVYLVTGLASILLGLSYRHLRSLLFDSDPIQLTLVIAGIALVLSSVFMQFFFKMREERLRDILEESRRIEGGTSDSS
jgi:hypothetical protein